MATNHRGNTQPAIDQEEHESGAMPPTKRVLPYGYDGSSKNLFYVDTNGIQRSIVTIASTIVTTGGQATVTLVSTPTLFAVVNTAVAGQSSVVLDTGANWIGLATVKVADVVPGTGVTNLGKTYGSLATATDVGVMVLGKVLSSDSHDSNNNDGNYGRLSLTDFRELRTRDQRAIDLCNCNDSTKVVALSNDTTNISNATNHVFGSGAIKFDKANGTDNSIYGGVWVSTATTNIAEIFEAGGYVGLGAYLPSLTNVVNIFLRVGTDANNYNTWTWPVADLTAASWLNLRKSAASPDYSRGAGNGWNTNGISYIAFGTEFAGETNALAGMHFDHVHIVGGRVTSSDINAAISSTVNTPNINLQRVGGTSTDTGNGNQTAGTLRVTVAADSTGQIKLAAGTAQIGSVTVSNPVTFGSNVSLNASNAWIGLATVVNGAGTAQIGSVTVANNITFGSNVSLNASNAWIGLATVTGGIKNAGTTKTLEIKNFGVCTASYATIFVPTTQFYATHLLLSSDATVKVQIMSGATYLAGNASIGISLAPLGGWVENGSVDSPIYKGLANGGAFVIQANASVNIGGKVVYYEE